jgi:hypothetical protein
MLLVFSHRSVWRIGRRSGDTSRAVAVSGQRFKRYFISGILLDYFLELPLNHSSSLLRRDPPGRDGTART